MLPADPSRRPEPKPAPLPVPVDPPPPPPVSVEHLQQEVAAAADFALAAPATRRAYRSDFQRFGIWCRRRGLVDLPAEPERWRCSWRARRPPA